MTRYPHKFQNMDVETNDLHTSSICARERKENNEMGQFENSSSKRKLIVSTWVQGAYVKMD